jgi:hypothetical protein
MKYVRTTGFLIDLRRLPDEHRKLFVQAVHEILRPALDAGAHKGAVPWPRALRVHRIGAGYSMTWSLRDPMAGRYSGWPRSLGNGRGVATCRQPRHLRLLKQRRWMAGSLVASNWPHSPN